MPQQDPSPLTPESSPAEDSLPASLHSERLLIRVARPGDGAALNRAALGSLDRLKPWLVWMNPPPTPAQSELTCQRAHAAFLRNQDLMALFFLKENGALVGCGNLRPADWELRHFEIGYWGSRAHARRGLMREGVGALVQHALTRLRAARVFLTTDEANTDSRRFAQSLGFRLEQVMARERLDVQGVPRNTCVYARGALP